MRGLGGPYTQPGPVEFMNHFRLLILSKDRDVVVGRSVQMQQFEESSVPSVDYSSALMSSSEE